MAEIWYHPKVKKDLKKLDKKIAQKILDYVPHLAEQPSQGVRLSGELHDFYKYKISLQGVSYRIIYKILSEGKIVIWIVFIGARENIYERLLRRIR